MLIKTGSTGPEVGIIQNNLKMLGYDPIFIDCIFGERTENAVKKFQKFYSLTVDGVIGDDTGSKLIFPVKDIQTALNKHGFDLIVDGIARLNTVNALIDFQKANNLLVDGIIGAETRNVLFPSVNKE